MASITPEVVDLTAESDEDCSDEDCVMIEKNDSALQISSGPSRTPSLIVIGFGSTLSRPQSVSSASYRSASRIDSVSTPSRPQSSDSTSYRTPTKTPLFANAFPRSFSPAVRPFSFGASTTNWNFPSSSSSSSSYGLVSKQNSPVPQSRTSSKRKASIFDRGDSETPTKRSNRKTIDMSSDTEDDCLIVERPQSMASMEFKPPGSASHRTSASSNMSLSSQAREVIDLEDEEEAMDLEKIFTEVFNDLNRRRNKSATITPRNSPIQPPLAMVTMTVHAGMQLVPLQTVQLINQDFLRIKSIIKGGAELILRGWLLRRTHATSGLLNAKLNELCWLFDVDLDDPRPILEQCVVDIPLTRVIAVRELISTNQSREARHFDRTELYRGGRGQNWIYDNGELFVRWKYVRTFTNAAQRMADKPCERQLSSLREEDCTQDEGICDEVLRHLFNDSSVCGGSSKALKKHVEALTEYMFNKEGFVREESLSGFAAEERPDEEQHRSMQQDVYSFEEDMAALSVRDVSTQPKPIDLTRGTEICAKSPGQMYTYGDIFSGAGGASRGAKLAGLCLVYAIDCWEVANITYNRNFPKSRLYQMLADQFITSMGEKGSPDMHVDILHLSPPCQYWSPAHTIDGKDDEKNLAALFSVIGMLSIIKPRVATVEQTFGLKNHKAFLNTLVNMFTSQGYSVRWAILQLADYGLPQSRQRLVMIAAAPGETLPTFPPITHNKDGSHGLKKWVTINDVLECIPEDALDHNVHAARFPPGESRPSFDGDTLANCITTSGGIGNYHPSGTRHYTIRELASLQTFPHDHEFVGPYVKRQIGNAVPPKALGKKLFTHLRQHLERFDRVVHEAFTVED